MFEDIRCAHDCQLYTYDEVISGSCPHVKYRGPIEPIGEPAKESRFTEDFEFHYHYSCILREKDSVAINEITKQKNRWESHLKKVVSVANCSRRMQINCLKTNYPYFAGLDGLINYNRENLSCYTKYLNNDNCTRCKINMDCKRLSILYPLIDEIQTEGNRDQLKEELKKLLNDTNGSSK
jgi:hypothetical protein